MSYPFCEALSLIHVYFVFESFEFQPTLLFRRFNPTNDGAVYAASSDGTISCTDLETGIALSLMNLNPDGWQVSFLTSLFQILNKIQAFYLLCEKLYISA